MIEFLGEAKIVAHNAEFDMRFHQRRTGAGRTGAVAADRVIDTLALARRRFPGASNSLDALCQRFGVDSSRRTKHGALLDAEILAEVYAELCGGRQAALIFGAGFGGGADLAEGLLTRRPAPLPPRLTEAELAAHDAFVEGLGDKALWLAYVMAPAAAAE